MADEEEEREVPQYTFTPEELARDEALRAKYGGEQARTIPWSKIIAGTALAVALGALSIWGISSAIESTKREQIQAAIQQKADDAESAQRNRDANAWSHTETRLGKFKGWFTAVGLGFNKQPEETLKLDIDLQGQALFTWSEADRPKDGPAPKGVDRLSGTWDVAGGILTLTPKRAAPIKTRIEVQSVSATSSPYAIILLIDPFTFQESKSPCVWAYSFDPNDLPE